MTDKEFNDIKVGDKFVINLNKNIIVTVSGTLLNNDKPTNHTLSWFNTLNELQTMCMYQNNKYLFMKVE
jgi:hypothetical protein